MKKKTCTRCGKPKPISEFHKAKSYKDGLRSWCIECHRKRNKENYKRNSEEIKEKHRQYYKENKEKVLRNQKLYYEQNKDKILERTAAYQREHIRECWVTTTFHNHKKRGFKVRMSRKELLVLVYDSDRCEICGAKLNWGTEEKNGRLVKNSPTLDRVDNEDFLAPHNVQIVCWVCNSTKSFRTMQEFIDYCKMIAEKFS